MIRLLQLLFYGHIHKWETESVHDLKMATDRGSRYILRCSECGDVKMVDLI